MLKLPYLRFQNYQNLGEKRHLVVWEKEEGIKIKWWLMKISKFWNKELEDIELIDKWNATVLNHY